MSSPASEDRPSLVISGRNRVTQARAEESRAAIIAAAMRLFAERGYDGVALRDVAALADRPLGVISYHFKSKDELWRCAAERVHISLQEHFSARLKGLEGVDQESCARLIIREFVRYFARHADIFRFMVHLGMTKSERLDWYSARFVLPFRGLFEAFFAELAAQHGMEVGSPDFAVLLYSFLGGAGLMHAIAAEMALTTGTDPSQEAVIDRHADLMIRLYLPGSRQK